MLTDEKREIFRASVKRFKELIKELEADLGYELTQDQKKFMIRDNGRLVESLDLTDMETNYYIEEFDKAYDGFPLEIGVYSNVLDNDIQIVE